MAGRDTTDDADETDETRASAPAAELVGLLWG